MPTPAPRPSAAAATTSIWATWRGLRGKVKETDAHNKITHRKADFMLKIEVVQILCYRVCANTRREGARQKHRVCDKGQAGQQGQQSKSNSHQAGHL